MKKIFYLFFFLFPFLALAQDLASPQAAPVPVGMTHPTTYVHAASAQSQIPADIAIEQTQISGADNGNRDLKLSFDIVNNTRDAYPELRAMVRLKRVTSSTTAQIVDEHPYADAFTLEPSSHLAQARSYVIPNAITAGSYIVSIEIGNKDGVTIALFDFSPLALHASAGQAIEIDHDSCHAFVKGKKDATGQLFVSAQDELFEECRLTSRLSGSTSAYPYFEIHYHNPYGDIATSSIAAEPLSLASGDTTVIFAVPHETVPQEYYALVSLRDKSGAVISNTDSFMYFVKGIAGDIANVAFDKVAYDAGDTAAVRIVSAIYTVGEIASVSAGTLSVALRDSAGNQCAQPMSQETSPANPDTIFALPVSRACANPSLHVVLSTHVADGSEKVLDTKDFAIHVGRTGLPIAMLWPLFLVLASVLVLLIGMRLFRKKPTLPGMAAFLIIMSLVTLALPKHASAISCFPNSNDANKDGYSGYFFCESTEDPITCSANWTGGCPMYWTGRTVSYYGYGGGFIGWPNTNQLASGNYLNVCDDGGKYCSKVYFQNSGSQFNPGAYITSAPSAAAYGMTANISWDSRGANWCDIWQDGAMIHQNAGVWGTASTKPITNNSSITVYCGSNYIPYSGTGITNPGQAGTTILVGPSDSITAASTSIPMNSSTTLAWSSSYADTCSLSSRGNSGNSNNLGQVSTSGSTSTGNLAKDTTFTLTCVKNGMSLVATDAVKITANPLTPTVNLVVSPTVVAAPPTTNIQWRTISANACSAQTTPYNGLWPGTVEPSNSATSSVDSLPLLVSTTFILTCTNQYGSGSSTATAWAQPPSPNTSVTNSCGAGGVWPIEVDWSPSHAANYYQIWRRSGNGGGNQFVQIGTTSANSFADSDVILGKKYSYFVTAVNYGPNNTFFTASSQRVSTTSAPLASCAVPTTSACSATQIGGPGGNSVYLNKQVSWTVSFPGISGPFSNPSLTIAGTDLPPAATSSLTFNKIYTTLGIKSVSASSTVIANGTIYTSTCVATTTVKLDEGKIHEI